MCGITALFLAKCQGELGACIELVEGLNLLQHRGQDAAGIITCNTKGRLFQCKGNGMVRDVFDQEMIFTLEGSMGVGHVRYPTAGTSSHSEAQPFYVNSPYGIVLAHNGNIVNAAEIKRFLDSEAHRHINTDSDSELLLNVFADHLQMTGKYRINEEDIFHALKGLMGQCHGGYACVGMIAGFGTLGFRDPHGIRPLVYGRRKTESGYDYMFASESVVLHAAHFTDITDVQPGEAVIVTNEEVSKKQLVADRQCSPCIFELVYFARPDSILDGISVYQARMLMGQALARKVQAWFYGPCDIDVVIPVPETSRVSALEVAHTMNLPYREGFVKNRYVGRTFIMPGQEMRRKSVRRKLNAIIPEFAKKNVLLVDDSIVRGTTSMEIVQMAREAGANKVYFASAAPPIRHPNVYGIDMPSSEELVAYNRTQEEVCALIEADGVIYQDLKDLIEACRQLNPTLTRFDTSVFDGVYITEGVTPGYLAEHGKTRRNKSKTGITPRRKNSDSSSSEIIGLHNSFTQK